MREPNQVMGQARAPTKLISSRGGADGDWASCMTRFGGLFLVITMTSRIAAQPGVPSRKTVFSQLPFMASMAGDAETPIAQPREMEPINRPLAMPCSRGGNQRARIGPMVANTNPTDAP